MSDRLFALGVVLLGCLPVIGAATMRVSIVVHDGKSVDLLECYSDQVQPSFVNRDQLTLECDVIPPDRLFRGTFE